MFPESPRACGLVIAPKVTSKVVSIYENSDAI
jgi:hypothetical protein